MNGPTILDLRSCGQRLLLERWRTWGGRPPVWARALDAMGRPVRRSVMARRRAGRMTPPSDRFVVAVGNLRVGGTGKTPTAIDLARGLAAGGGGGAILTRGYGSSARGPLTVRADDDACGDEARLMASAQPWPVIQAVDRVAGFETAYGMTSPGDVILLEDGFQTAGVGRHLDLLIVDAWTVADGRVEPAAGPTLPWGPYREDAAAASAADVWIVPVADAGELRDLVAEKPLLRMVRRTRLPDGLGEEPYGVICGLARPEVFEAACAREAGRRPVLAARFADHAAYGDAAVRTVLERGEALGVRAWLTTAKDHGKLAIRWPTAPPLLTAALDLAWPDGSPADLIAGRLENRG